MIARPANPSQAMSFRQLTSVIAISWSGAFLEWLDFYTYAVYAGIVAKVFFPSTDPIASLLYSFAALAIGFLFRPLGALLFGHIGDRFGRKVSFVIAATMMLAGTFGIGLLPGYSTLGIIASISVFILRIIQGLALGGGYGSAMVYLGEFAPEDRRGLVTGILFTTPAAGLAVASNILAMLQNLYGKQALGTWAWRLGFIIAGIAVFVVAMIMYFVYKETPIFTTLKTIRRVTSAPIRELFSNRQYVFLVLLAWIGVVGAHGPIWYTNQLYVTYFMQFHKISPGLSNYILALATYLALWTYVFFGWLSDKVGRRPILLLGIYGNAIIIPLVFYIMGPYADASNFYALLGLTAVLTYFNGIGYSGAMSAYLLELFPARIRLTAVAFAYNMGYGITGGLTPFMITLIYKFTGNLLLSITLWSTVLPIIMGLLFVLKGWETLGTRIWSELSVGKFVKQSFTLPATTSISELASKLLTKGYRFAAVINSLGRYVGIVEEREILRVVANGIPYGAPISEIAIKIECLNEKSPLMDAVTLMNKYNVRGIAVCDDSGKVIGLLDARDMFNEATVLKIAIKKPITLRLAVRDVISRDPITVKQGTPINDVLKIMVSNNIGFVPVINDKGELVGVLSERDLVGLVASGIPLSSSIDEYMKRNPVTLNENATIRDAINAIMKYGVRHLPIINEKRRVVGVISIKDLLRFI